ncbi:hypothetical protein [Haloferula sp.]|uniref:hypothetical protein n=1 Tax=Haloferula sp. TaxID=2497595 RepID=UPI003C764E25
MAAIMVLLLVALLVSRQAATDDDRQLGVTEGMQDRDGTKEVEGLLNAALVGLSGAENPGESAAILSELKEALFSMPREDAVEVIADFLSDSSGNAATGMSFAIGEGGKLDQPTSLRVALIDWLGQLDKQRAGEVAEQILSEPTHPDEWALCLRNYAWAHPDLEESSDYLIGKWEQMIGVESWMKEPSVGFLEAFDVVVHARAVELTPRLAEMLADPSGNAGAVRHAAFLTMDRLVVASPAEMIAALDESAELLDGSDAMHAQMVARADLSEPEQRQQVEEFLLDPERSVEQLDVFAQIFPNANYMVSSNLLTTTIIPDGAERRRRDQAALSQVERWLADDRFVTRLDWLRLMRDRLQGFVSQPAVPE